jgi:hypothetical protein
MYFLSTADLRRVIFFAFDVSHHLLSTLPVELLRFLKLWSSRYYANLLRYFSQVFVMVPIPKGFACYVHFAISRQYFKSHKEELLIYVPNDCIK